MRRERVYAGKEKKKKGNDIAVDEGVSGLQNHHGKW